jgi:hypothetical protein
VHHALMQTTPLGAAARIAAAQRACEKSLSQRRRLEARHDGGRGEIGSCGTSGGAGTSLLPSSALLLARNSPSYSDSPLHLIRVASVVIMLTQVGTQECKHAHWDW